MARKQGKTGEAASADLVVWTNVSKNPVILGDGSTVGAGQQTTPEQAEFAEGSLWEEHGVLVSGAPVLMDDGADQIAALTAEVETLRGQLAAAASDKEVLLAEVEELKKQIAV
ncbi:hypothetical protein [Pseudomonas fontis]|uniref:Head fiber protein n=1 Tax=Pseudomonas fontis TaxID=2942633 RepID=A0ABT5NLU1_9PSED|nr:hypothetical protein [Pseudomonas fontis]MDD0974860.1 hypothetical protein [Pseudomonas fontis]MDD0989301.1 hypothetical protein [Pseudomonas fontis]